MIVIFTKPTARASGAADAVEILFGAAQDAQAPFTFSGLSAGLLKGSPNTPTAPFTLLSTTVGTFHKQADAPAPFTLLSTTVGTFYNSSDAVAPFTFD